MDLYFLQNYVIEQKCGKLYILGDLRLKKTSVLLKIKQPKKKETDVKIYYAYLSFMFITFEEQTW